MVVEAAVVVPAAMLVVLFAVQACLWAHAATVVQDAANQGSQAATALGGSAATGTLQAESVLATSARHIVLDPAVNITQMSGDLMRTKVTGRAESIIPGIDLPVSAVRIGVVQGFKQSG
ncbi:MAG: TadE/TadG family type IV pilus assembly protein [Nitrososphaerales archaeon]